MKKPFAISFLILLALVIVFTTAFASPMSGPKGNKTHGPGNGQGNGQANRPNQGNKHNGQSNNSGGKINSSDVITGTQGTVSPSSFHRVGIVTAYTPGVSITILAHDGNNYTFNLAPNVKILPKSRASMLGLNSLVTLIIPRKNKSTFPLVVGIVVHPAGSGAGAFHTPTPTFTPTPTMTATATATATATSTPTETAIP